jgi:hypothetical protein
MKPRTKSDAKRKRFNTIETDDDWDEKDQQRRATIHRFTNHEEGYYMSSLDQSMYWNAYRRQTYSTKNKQRKEIKFYYSQKEPARSQKDTTQKKRSEVSLSKSKSKHKRPLEKSVKPEKNISKRPRSLSAGNNKKPKPSPKKSELAGHQQQQSIPTNLSDFETFEPKQSFI